jgi:hypothetical protein
VLAPSAAETLVALGAGERIVAIGDWISWPPELPRCLLGASWPEREALASSASMTPVTTSWSPAEPAGSG